MEALGRAVLERLAAAAATRRCSTPAAARDGSPRRSSSGCRAAASSPSTRPRRWSPPRAGASATARDIRRRRPARARARRAGRRGALDGDLPLDRRPRPRCSRACTRRCVPVASSSRSAVARATSPNVHRVADEVGAREPFAAYLKAGADRGTSARPSRPARRFSAPASPACTRGSQPVPVIPEDPREYLRTINLGAQLERLPDGAARRLRAPRSSPSSASRSRSTTCA